MKNTELRIGSLVKMKGGTSIFQVDEIAKGFIQISNILDFRNWTNVDYDNIEGIILTEDWLIRLGFQKHEYKVSNCDYFTKGFVVLLVKDNDFKASVSDLESRYLTTLQSIHQLQNLYFSLIGEDLNINN